MPLNEEAKRLIAKVEAFEQCDGLLDEIAHLKAENNQLTLRYQLATRGWVMLITENEELKKQVDALRAQIAHRLRK